jgi:uncharacterized protein with PIN domain
MERAEEQKSTHSAVDYTPHAAIESERCALCNQFIRPNRCETVKKPIAAAGWCKEFERK